MPEENANKETNQETIETKPEVKTTEQVLKEKLAGSVSKEEYQKVVEENNKLSSYILDGKRSVEEREKESTKNTKSLEDLKKELYGNDHLTNLECAKRTLEIRDKIISEGGQDPFLPTGHHVTIEQNDIDKANKVAEGLKHCVEVSEDNPELFNMELARITKDAMPIGSMRR